MTVALLGSLRPCHLRTLSSPRRVLDPPQEFSPTAESKAPTKTPSEKPSAHLPPAGIDKRPPPSSSLPWSTSNTATSKPITLPASRLNCVVIVLTLLAIGFLLQVKATRGTFLRMFRPRNISQERWPDDPRGQSTCNASPGATTSRRARQCLGSLPGIGDLPLPVLPLAKSVPASTVEMGFIPNATRGAEAVPTACRSRTNERSLPWRCRIPRVGPVLRPAVGSAAASPVSEHHLPGSASRRTGYAA